MVNIGIIGADSPMAGEVIRILINHPEINLVSLFSPSLKGRTVASVHHGLIGENSLKFCDKLDINELDFIILMENNEFTDTILEKYKDFENLHLVAIESMIPLSKLKGFEIGTSEINRKALVRGAKKAFIPSPAIVPSLVALGPLALFLLLNSDIDIEVSLPEDIAFSLKEKQEEKKLSDQLKKIQSSFNGNVTLKIDADHQNERAGKTIIKFHNTLPLEELEKIYDQIYDDHNFAFTTNNESDTREVEGTQKIIISIKKPDSENLVIETISDARLRGGAGDIVHVMNLFFGLHEKTGLHLKPSRF